MCSSWHNDVSAELVGLVIIHIIHRSINGSYGCANVFVPQTISDSDNIKTSFVTHI